MITEIDLLPLHDGDWWPATPYEMRAEMQAYARANVARNTALLRAEIEALRAEVERLKSMTAVTMGVGSGGGNLFVHGDYESIKAAQDIVLERDKLRAENEAMKRCAIKYLGWLGVTHMPLDQALYDDMHNPSMCGDAALSKEDV